MDKQTVLDQHRAIFLATIDYFLERGAARVIIDQDDMEARYYEKLKQKAEKHYQNGRLDLLQRVMRKIGWSPRMLQDDSYMTFINERIDYDVEILKQILFDKLLKYKNKGVFIKEIFINEGDIIHKDFTEKYSPDNKRKIIVDEGKLPEPGVTNVTLHFSKASINIYTVEGTGLDITVYWKDNNTVIIETRKDYVASSKHGEQYQSLDDIVKVEYVLH